MAVLQSRHTTSDATSPPTIVVIDDDPICVAIARFTLERMGYRVVACQPHPAARTYIVHIQPAAIVLDVQMPELDGIEFFCDLRADPVTQTIPVIFVTGSPADVRERLPDFQEQGAWLIGKPYAPTQLEAIVGALLPLLAREY